MNPCLAVFAFTVTMIEPPRPVAMVLEISDQSIVWSARKPNTPRRLEEINFLYPGDQIKAVKGFILVIYFKPGHYERIVEGAKAEVTEAGGRAKMGIEILERKPERADLERLRELSGVTAGVTVLRSASKNELLTVCPTNFSTVLTKRPRLSWLSVPDTAKYEVRLVALGSEKVLLKGETKQLFFECPKDLAGGETYLWRVTARDGDQKLLKQTEARFTVATTEVMANMPDSEKIRTSKDSKDWLLAALAYESIGAADEALQLYERLARERPKEATYQDALAYYLRRAGRKEEAVAAERKAVELRK